MQSRIRTVFFIVVAALSVGWYLAEPWAVTFVDDGPYYSEDFLSPIDKLPVHSSVQLRRFGALAFTLQSRLLPGKEQSVLVLWDSSGHQLWAKLPVKPDGELGSLRLRDPRLTWNGGWRVRIIPSNQEAGNLYLGPFGGFRFFNHSW